MAGKCPNALLTSPAFVSKMSKNLPRFVVETVIKRQSCHDIMGQQSEDAEDSRRRITGRVKGEKEWQENRQRQEVESKTTRDDIIYKIKQETNIRCVKVISILTYLSQYRSIRSTDSIL